MSPCTKFVATYLLFVFCLLHACTFTNTQFSFSTGWGKKRSELSPPASSSLDKIHDTANVQHSSQPVMEDEEKEGSMAEDACVNVLDRDRVAQIYLIIQAEAKKMADCMIDAREKAALEDLVAAFGMSGGNVGENNGSDAEEAADDDDPLVKQLKTRSSKKQKTRK